MIERWDPLWTQVKFVLHLTRFTNASNLEEWSMIWTMCFLFPQTSNLHIRKLCCMCLKTMKQWSRWSLKEGARQWDMFPEPTELLLIGCSIESIWTPRSKSNTLTPKTNSQTCWPREISHVMNGIICCVCLTSAISVPPIVFKSCPKERKKMQVKKESQQSRNQWWIWSRDAVKELPPRYLLLHQKVLWKPDTKVNCLWARGLSSILEQGDLISTLTHQVTQNGILIKFGLLKSRNQMIWWKIEQGDLLYTHSTRTDLLWGMFMSSTLQASVFMVKNYSDNWHSIKNTEDLTMKQMFDISEKLVSEQSDEIYGVKKINWEDSSWKYLSLIGDEQVISLLHAKVYVFSDSVLCLGKVNENPQSNIAREDRLTWIKSSLEYRTLERIDGEPIEFEWNIFPGFTILQLCHKVQQDWA